MRGGERAAVRDAWGSVCLGVDTDGTKISPLLLAGTGTGEVTSKAIRSAALGISSASDGAGREMLVLVVEVDDGTRVGVDGAEIETAVVTTRPPVVMLVTGNATPVSFPAVFSVLFSGLSFRLALRVCRVSGVCAGDVVVCLPFCGDISRCVSFCTATDAADLLGKSILLTISASIDFCSVTFAFLGPLDFIFSVVLDVVLSIIFSTLFVSSDCSSSYSTSLFGCSL